MSKLLDTERYYGDHTLGLRADLLKLRQKSRWRLTLSHLLEDPPQRLLEL